jgi:hypothetical protein
VRLHGVAFSRKDPERWLSELVEEQRDVQLDDTDVAEIRSAPRRHGRGGISYPVMIARKPLVSGHNRGVQGVITRSVQ